MSILPNLQIQFPAGKMNFDPITKKVLADPRKGSIRVYQNSDNEKRFFWIDEVSKTEEIDLYVFENDAKFEKVVQAKGRIYLLRFDSMEEKYFFWFQDPDVSTDEKNLNKVNEILNFHEKIEEEIEEHKAQPQIESNFYNLH